MQHNYMKQYFVKVYLVLYNLVIGKVRFVLRTSNEIRVKTDKSLVYVFTNRF